MARHRDNNRNRNRKAADDNDQIKGSSSSGGAQATTPSEQTVQFINAEVLSPPTEDPLSFAKPYADQVAAMMLEDARAFMQGTEQVLTIAISRSLEEIIAGEEARGTAGLTACQTMMTALPAFGAAVAATSAAILGDFE